MANTVRILRSTTAGNTPASLVSGQIAVNEADGRIFYRSAAGAVTTFSSIASYATSASFPATGSSSVLYLASDSSRLYQWNGVYYVEIGVAGGSGSSSYTLPNATTSTLGGVVVGTGLSVSSGTVSANVVSVAGRTGTVTISSGDVSGLATVATSGSYTDLSNRYTLPNATGSTLGGVVVGTGLSVSSGTVSANVVSVAGRTGTVTISSSDVSGLPTAGTGSTNYCAGNDSRLSDSRTPTAHASSHASGGADAISIAASQLASGTISTARLASGTANSTTYLRGDQTYATLDDDQPILANQVFG